MNTYEISALIEYYAFGTGVPAMIVYMREMKWI